MHLSCALKRISNKTQNISRIFQNQNFLNPSTESNLTSSSTSSSSSSNQPFNSFFSIEISNQRSLFSTSKSLLFSSKITFKNQTNLIDSQKQQKQQNQSLFFKNIIFQQRTYINEEQRRQLKTPQFPERETLYGYYADQNTWKTASFYRFCDLSSFDLNLVKSELMKKWHQLSITGRIYISPEGINGYISLPPGRFLRKRKRKEKERKKVIANVKNNETGKQRFDLLAESFDSYEPLKGLANQLNFLYKINKIHSALHIRIRPKIGNKKRKRKRRKKNKKKKKKELRRYKSDSFFFFF